MMLTSRENFCLSVISAFYLTHKISLLILIDVGRNFFMGAGATRIEPALTTKTGRIFKIWEV